MSTRWVRELSCRDVAGRSRLVSIFVGDENEVGLSVPAGEVARFKPDELRALQQLLVNASIEATHRGAGHVGERSGAEHV